MMIVLNPSSFPFLGLFPDWYLPLKNWRILKPRKLNPDFSCPYSFKEWTNRVLLGFNSSPMSFNHSEIISLHLWTTARSS
jgi:hypothetical protein